MDRRIASLHVCAIVSANCVFAITALSKTSVSSRTSNGKFFAFKPHPQIFPRNRGHHDQCRCFPLLPPPFCNGPRPAPPAAGPLLLRDPRRRRPPATRRSRHRLPDGYLGRRRHPGFPEGPERVLPERGERR